VHDEAAALGVDVERIAVGGDSAGGGLAASLTQLVSDRGTPPIRFQLLAYPMLDDRTVVRAEADGLDALFWTPASNRFAWTAYLGHEPGKDAEPPYAAAARREDLAGLPPAWIGVGDIELFHDEDVDYARRLAGAGVPCELHVEPGMFHAADLVRSGVPSMRTFRDRMVEALGAALDRGPAAAGSREHEPAGS
jgi:acetyl esterase/lipase